MPRKAVPSETLYVCNSCGRIAGPAGDLRQKGDEGKCADGSHNWRMFSSIFTERLSNRAKEAVRKFKEGHEA